MSIAPAEPRVPRTNTRAVEAHSVATLVRQLRRHYDGQALDTAS